MKIKSLAALVMGGLILGRGFAQTAPAPAALPANSLPFDAYPATTGHPIDLWPEGIPGYRADGPAETIQGDRVLHVRHPTLIAYLPPAGTANGTAVVDCPGGGYVRLPSGKMEGAEPRWLNRLGVTVFVLTYRFGDDSPAAPLQDVLRAVRLVRSHAADYGIRPDRIGVMGDSAGGHVATSAATLYDDPAGRTGSPLDKVSGRPDFTVLLYPVITMRDPFVHKGSRGGLLGPHPTPEMIDHYSTELHVTKDTPPAFIVSTQEDKSVPLENAVAYFMALRNAGIPAQLQLFEKGPHGFGFTPGLGPTSGWPARCEEWLRYHGWLPASPAEADASIGSPPSREHDRFMQLHQSFLARGHAGPIGVLFLGDSIVNHWRIAPQIWEKYFGKYQPANFGIPGDMTQNVIWRIEQGEFDGLHPRVVVFMLGTNNSGVNTAAEIFAADRKIVELLRAKMPETKVLLLAIFPRGSRQRDGSGPDFTQRMTVINAVNAQLATLDDGQNVRYLDIGAKFRGPDGKIPATIMADGVHPTVAGFQIWADAMQPQLEAMLQPAQ
jgi:acetyl esterase/lipase/lysophospholipase L1-like esterase